MNHLETIKKAVEWARKNPQAYAEFVERRRKEAEEDAAIESEARAEEAKERQAAKEAKERAAKGPTISISGEGGGTEGTEGTEQTPQAGEDPTEKAEQETPSAPTPPMPPPEGENKPVGGVQGEGEWNDAPTQTDEPRGEESPGSEGEKGEAAQDEGGESDGGMTFTDDEGNTYTLPPPEIDEGDEPPVPFPD